MVKIEMRKDGITVRPFYARKTFWLPIDRIAMEVLTTGNHHR
jgi:hypothetical protein